MRTRSLTMRGGLARWLAAALLLAALAIQPARAGDWNTGEGNSGDLNTGAGAAIGGVDPVAYFTDGQAVVGAPGIAHQWDGTTWHFASVANRDAFAADPEAYAPQYGGYCAFGVAHGAKPDIDPHAWTIRDGKLYLNYDLGVRDQWRADAATYIDRADANWLRLRTGD